jgi:menaquinone-specific isochorismate synthase
VRTDRETVVRSTRLDVDGDLLARLPRRTGSLAWTRAGDGLVGWGEHARFEVRGRDRFARAQAWWQEQLAALRVEDDVALPGTGPVAFGSFAFADDSEQSSVLVVPEVVLGRRGDVGWLTTTGPAPRPAEPAPVRGPGRVRYSSGAMPVTRYRQAVADAVRLVRAGRLDKVVLAHDLLAVADEDVDTRFLLARLAERYPDCWTFAVDGLVGATPELLVSRRGGRVLSRVLAGTVARGADAAEDTRLQQDLLGSAKDLEEHRYAVESLADVLGTRCSRLDVPAAPHVLELSNVAHLASDLAGELAGDPADGSGALELAAQLHPTAAVGGTPTGDAVRLLAELEGMDRGRYAGPVGWLGAAGDGDWGIALRCAQVDGSSARLFAGCGIVAGSEPDDEVREAQAKLVAVRDALEGAGR